MPSVARLQQRHYIACGPVCHPCLACLSAKRKPCGEHRVGVEQLPVRARPARRTALDRPPLRIEHAQHARGLGG